MHGPIDLSDTTRVHRKRTLEKMDDHQLRKAQRIPGAYGAGAPMIQREIDEELEERRLERERSLVTESPGDSLIDDPLDGSLETDDLLDQGFSEPLDQDHSETIDLDVYEELDEPLCESIDWETVLETYSEVDSNDGTVDDSELAFSCRCSIPSNASWVEGENHESGCMYKSIFENTDEESASKDGEEDSSGSSSSGGGGAITGGVVGGAVGSVGGPAGAAVGAAAGAFLGKLFD